MMLSDERYRLRDLRKLIKGLGYPVQGIERSDSVNPVTIRLTAKIHVEFHTKPNRFKVIKEDKGLFYRSEMIRDTNDLVQALNRAGLAPAMRQYFAAKVTYEEGENGELERVYTFISEDKSAGIQMRWHSEIFMKVVVLRHTNMELPSNYDLALALIASSRSNYEILTLK